jgi:hypothetical protein
MEKLMRISNRKFVFPLMVFFVAMNCYAETYTCKPLTQDTASTFRGQLFKLKVEKECIDLKNLESKENWSWKVVTFNSLGDKDGVRKFCNQPDDGFPGNPAYWKQDSKLFYSFDPKHIHKFQCFLEK